jgi:FkbM family methyltransferase
LRLSYQRLALYRQARREKRGRAVTLRQDGDLVRVNDGAGEIVVPHARLAARYGSGINTRLEAVAEKYTGGTGYVPREGDIVLDIGAGIGEFTLWCARTGAHVVAFEPDPLALACLERNTASLGAVRIVPCALWKERADLRLHGSVDTTESSLIETGRGDFRNANVEAWPLDQLDYVVRLPVIDFMKVAGEGVEPEILAGAARTLRRTRILSVDVGSTEKRPKLRSRVEAILESLNFSWLPQDQGESILALNTAMVGPFSSRALDRHSS